MTIDPAKLLGPAAATLREHARDVAGGGGGDVETLLRRVPDADRELARQVLVQETLRLRARDRFGALADHMLFTRDGLEQATSPAVATRRARRIRAAGIGVFVDLGCGLGIDSMAAIRSGLSVVAVERDETTAAFARHNIALARHNIALARQDAGLARPGTATTAEGVEVRVVLGDVAGIGEATASDRDESRTAWFVDPARRQGHRPDGTPVRSMRPESWQPPWSWVVSLAERHRNVVAKAAPGLPHADVPPDAAVEWVSVAGRLLEATVWFGGLADGMPPRAAVLLDPDEDPWGVAAERCLPGTSPQRDAHSGPLGAWLLEPDPAVIRAHLIAQLCERVGGRVLSRGIAYVTTDEPPAPEFGRVDRILEALPAQPKRLRQELRRRGIGSAEIRTRGLALQPERLRRDLQLSGDGVPAHLVLTRLEGRAAALLVEPVGGA